MCVSALRVGMRAYGKCYDNNEIKYAIKKMETEKLLYLPDMTFIK